MTDAAPDYAELIERLEKVEPDTPGEGVTRYYRNPDGPEAAAAFRTLLERNAALADALRGLLKAYENTFDWTVELPPETAEAERIANEVLEAFTAGKPEQECATEGCDEPATDYFERGGVGSHYCHGCYLKVQAVATPLTAGGDDE